MPYIPTFPVDHGWPAAHSTAEATSACSPGPTQSRQPVDPPKPRRSTITTVYPWAIRSAPSMRSVNRCEGPATGCPSSPVCPMWLKYGPTDRITGVRASAGRCAGRSTSACSSTSSPLFDGSEEGKYSCVHTAPSGTCGFCSWVMPSFSSAEAAVAARLAAVGASEGAAVAVGTTSIRLPARAMDRERRVAALMVGP